MSFRSLSSLVLCLLTAAAMYLPTAADAQFSRQDLKAALAQSPTLQRIKETRTIVMGVRETVAPFSYNSGADTFYGYTVELCEDVIRSLRLDLGVESLRVVYMPVTGKDRVEIIADGNADMECGSTTNTAERQKKVSFANAHFHSVSNVVGRKGLKMTSLADLKGMKVALPDKTIQLKAIQAANEQQKLGIVITTYKDPQEAFLAVLGGNADFTSTDDLFLLDLMLNTPGAKDKLQIYQGFSMLPNTYGIMLPKDAAFVEVFNNYLNAMYRGGRAQKAYERWLMNPIPPKNQNLSFPMSQELKRLFDEPSNAPLL